MRKEVAENCFVQRLVEEMAMPFFRYFSLLPLLFPFVNPRVSCKFCLLCHLAVIEKSVTSVKKLVKLKIWTTFTISNCEKKHCSKNLCTYLNSAI